MYTIESELESRSSCYADRLVFTSGLYCLITSGDQGYDRWDGSARSAVECGRANGLCTPDKGKAYQQWLAFTASHWSRNQ